MFKRAFAAFTIPMFALQALAQVQVQCTWETSLDNGTSWQSGSITAPQSQSSVLVRAVTTVSVNGVSVPTGTSSLTLTRAVIEGWSTTSTPTNDTMTGIALLGPSLPTAMLSPLTTLSLQSRRFGNLLTADRQGDTTPPGQGAGFIITNTPDAFGGVPSFQNPLVIFVMRIALDGSTGDRTFSGALVGFSFSGANVASGAVATGNSFQPSSQWQSTPVTQTPATLTIIPTPATLALFTISSLFATRRRRS